MQPAWDSICGVLYSSRPLPAAACSGSQLAQRTLHVHVPAQSASEILQHQRTPQLMRDPLAIKLKKLISVRRLLQTSTLPAA
jgi:hypothetical protein